MRNTAEKINEALLENMANAWSIVGMGTVEKMILVYLAAHTNPTNRLVENLPVREIANECCCSVSTVMKKLARLEARGLLASRKPPGGKSSYMLLFVKPKPMVKPRLIWGRN